MKRILLIDGSSLIFRAFYAIRNLSTREGVPTGAVYGFINMYNAAIERIKPDYVLVAFDNSGPNIRTMEFAEYKGTRQKTPDELLTQFGIVKDLLDSYNVKHIALDDFEADDIIGTLSYRATKKGIKSYMLTGDRDYFQLVSENANVLYTKKGISTLEIYDLDKVHEQYDLSPRKLIEVKGLMGDASDNIPGVPGIGEKTAIKLVKEYGDIESIYENIDDIKGKVLNQNLRDNKAQAFMSRKLGTIYTDLELDFDIEDLKLVEPNRNELYEKFKVLEFGKLTQEFSPNIEEAFNFEPLIVGLNRMADVYHHVKSEKRIIFDIICEGDYLIEKPRYLAIMYKQNHVMLVDLMVDELPFVTKFKDIFEDEEIVKIGFDIKKQMVLLDKLDIHLEKNYQDLMIISYLINPKGDYSLKDIAFSELEKDIKSLEEYLGKGKGKKSVETLEKVYIEEYLSNNLFVIENSIDQLLEKLEDVNMKDLLFNVDLPLVRVLAEMEMKGVETHKGEFDKIDKEISERLKTTINRIYELAGEEFNINSTKQLGEILFDKLKLPVIKKTKTGYSTNADVLAKLIDVQLSP